MFSLVISELHKLGKHKLYLILLVAIVVIPTWLSIHDSASTVGINALKSNIKREKEYAGEITESWLQKQIDTYNERYPAYLDSILDESKMMKIYGENWRQNIDLYDCIYQYQDTRGDCKVYYLDHFPSDDKMQNVDTKTLVGVIDYGKYILNQEWENFDKREYHHIGTSENGEMVIEYEEMTPEIERENEQMKQSFRKENHFYYGGITIMKSALDSLQLIGVLLGFYLLMLFSAMFNKEEKEDTISLLKTTKYGKRKMISAKIITTILLAIFIPIVVIGAVLLIHSVILGTPDWNAPFNRISLTYLHRITTLTLKSTLWIVTGLFIVGSLFISMISLLLSRMMKSSYHSLIVGFLILVVPLFVFDFQVGTFSLKSLIPIEYMHFSYHLLVETSTIANHTFYDVMFILKTGILPFCLIPIILEYDKRKEVVR